MTPNLRNAKKNAKQMQKNAKKKKKNEKQVRNKCEKNDSRAGKITFLDFPGRLQIQAPAPG